MYMCFGAWSTSDTTDTDSMLFAPLIAAQLSVQAPSHFAPAHAGGFA